MVKPPPSPMTCRFLPRAVAAVALCCAAPAQVVINEVSSVQNERLLQDPEGAPPKLGATPRWHDPEFAVPAWWAAGAGPFGFGYTQATDPQAEMLGITPVLYLRRAFTATAAQAASASQVELLIDYDDGFVAFLNGAEVARRNTGAAGSFAWHSQTAFNTRTAGAPETIALGAAATRLRPGANVLAIQVHNNAVADNRLRGDATLRLGGTAPETLVAAADQWQWFAGTHEPAGGLCDGADFTAAPPPGPDWTQPAYDDTAWAEGPGALGFDTAAAGTEYLPQLGTNLLTMRNSAWSVYMRREFILSPQQLAALTATALTVDWDDGYVLHLNGYELSRGSLGGAPGTFLPFNTAASNHGARHDGGGDNPAAVAAVPVPRHLLRAGRNVLSAQLHNNQLGSSDLLLDVRFTATSGGSQLTLVTLGSPWRYRIATSEFATPAPPAAAPPAPEFLDWVELANTGTETADLGGWTLTDDPGQPPKWAFPPGTTLAPGGFLVVACSGRDVTTPAPGGLLHTNFSLSSNGEYLALRDAAGTLRAELADVPDQDPFHSWGIDPGSGEFRFLEAATPGAPNATGTATGTTAEVEFDRPTGFHSAPLQVALACPTPGATIRYTLDGSEPAATSTPYTGPFDPTDRPAPGPGTGTILREFFKWNDGTYVTPATFRISFANTTPTSARLITAFEPPTGTGDFYTQRVRGFVHPPQTGSYRFYIAADDAGELWLSTDDQPSNMSRVAWLAGWVAARDWTANASQQSAEIGLVAGRRYSIEALHSEHNSGDHLAVGWSGPGLPAGVSVIGGSHLSPPQALPPGTDEPARWGTVRARAFAPGRLPGAVRTRNYVTGIDARLAGARAVFLSGPAARTFYAPDGIFAQVGGNWASGSWVPDDPRFDYNFCLVHGDAFERPVALEVIDPGNVVVERTTVGARFAGSPWSRPQYQLRDIEWGEWNGGAHGKPQVNLFFRGDFGAGRLEHDGFIPASRLGEWDTLRLRAGKNDPYNPFIVDEWMRRTFAGMGAPAPQGFFATLFVNGQFKGYFNPSERPRESFYQEFHRSGNGWDVNVNGEWENGDAAASNEMTAFFRDHDFGTLANYQQGAALWDMANVADYFVLNAWAATHDWPQNNYVFVRERAPGAQWRFSMWDAEGALGIFGQANTHNTFETDLHVNSTTTPISSEWAIAPLVFRRACQNPEFRLLFADRLQRHFHNGGVMTRAAMQARWDAMRAEVEPLVRAVFNQDLNQGYWNNWAGRDATFFSQCRALGLWPATLAPAMTPFGGAAAAVALANPNGAGTLLYTTDGSDPRAVGGGVQGTAYAAPVPVTGPFTLKARVRSAAGEWSPLVEAAFASAVPPRVVVGELNYNPPGDGDATEFVELLNAGSAPAALAGAHFSAGIDYTFGDVTLAPGATFVLVKDAAAFAAAYPTAAIGGVFTGALDNAGETLTLRDITGAVILSFSYGDASAAGWPASPDGGGSTLVLRRPFDPATDPALAANWRTSAAAGGAPGAVDSTVFTGDPRADADRDGHCALLEYALGTSDAAAASRPAIVTALDHAGHLTLEFTRPAAADDVTLEVLESTTLDAWQPAVALGELPVPPGLLLAAWRSAATGPRVFLRLRASQ